MHSRGVAQVSRPQGPGELEAGLLRNGAARRRAEDLEGALPVPLYAAADQLRPRAVGSEYSERLAERLPQAAEVRPRPLGSASFLITERFLFQVFRAEGGIRGDDPAVQELQVPLLEEHRSSLHRRPGSRVPGEAGGRRQEFLAYSDTTASLPQVLLPLKDFPDFTFRPRRSSCDPIFFCNYIIIFPTNL